MDRRETLSLLALAALSGVAPWASPAAAHAGFDSNAPRPRFAMLVYPDMVLLDLVPAQTVFALTMGDVQLVWKDRSPVRTDVGVMLTPTTTFAECERKPDVLFVPGGLGGTVAAMNDPDVLAFVQDVGGQARYVTSVCTGSILLGAAGLLNGYRATGHWQSRYVLPQLGAILSDERVVIDRNRITGGGVTAGLDFGLVVASLIRGEEWAKTIQLVLEYAPQPPFNAGTLEGAGAAVSAKVNEFLSPGLQPLDRAVTAARTRLHL